MGTKNFLATVVRYLALPARDYVAASAFGAFVGGFAFCATHFSSDPNVRSFAVGMVPELLGIVFTVLVLERLSERARQVERDRLAALPARRIRRLLTGNLSVWLTAYKAASSSEPKDPPKTPEALLNREDLLYVLVYLDFNAECYVALHINGSRGVRWLESLGRSQKVTFDGLKKVLEEYGTFMPPAMLEALTWLLECTMWNIIQSHATMVDRFRRTSGIAPNFAYLSQASGGVGGMFLEWVERMKSLLAVCQAEHSPGALDVYNSIWNPGSKPQVGSGRVTDEAALLRRY